MKLLFSLLAILAFKPIPAQTIFYVVHHSNFEKASIIKKVMEQHLNIPSRNISIYKSSRPCQRFQRAVFQICVLADDIQIVDWSGNNFEATKVLMKQNRSCLPNKNCQERQL